MFKTFTSKFFAIYTATTFVIFLLLFGVFTQVISNYFIESKQKSMIEEANSICQKFIESYDNPEADTTFLQYQIRTLSFHLQSRIFLLLNNQVVFMDSDETAKNFIGKRLDNDIIQHTLEGETIATTGSFNDLFVDHMVTVSVPVLKEGTVIGCIIMNAPYPSLKHDISYVYNLTLFCLLIILSVTYISTYVYAKSVSATFSQFNNSAKAIASGNFTARVKPQEGSGEIWELANNMNFMAEELEKLEDLRKDFIANISHDFRSPLTSIKGFVQAILDGTIPHERQDRYLNIVLDETDRLTKLTNDILLLTKMENEAYAPDRTVFDIHEVIRKTLLRFEQKILEKSINITLLIDKKELLVYADINQIQRCITNLVDNAVKFCRVSDAIEIETTVKKDKVHISISDTGPGILEDDLKYIWQRFHKADRSRGKDKKGVGLGLSIVQEILRAHNEHIDVMSKIDKGTSFTFTLSLAEQERHRRPHF